MDGAVLNINSTTYNLNLAALSTSLYGSVLPYTILNVNAPIYGTNGANGVVTKVLFSYDYQISSYPTSGTSAINLSGFSGKTVKINNNSIIQGGNGGNGVSGGTNNIIGTAISCYAYNFYGATGGSAIINSGGVTLSINGNSVINGNNGFNGIYYANCQDGNSG